MIRFRIFLNLLVITLLLPSVCGCGGGHSYIHTEGLIWNTSYHVSYEGEPELADSIVRVLEEVGKSLSVFDPESLVSKLNASDSIKADGALLRIYETSCRIHKESGGMFDPTLSPLITAWGFGKGHKPTADTLKIDSLLHLTGIGRTRLTDGWICKPTRAMQFNFSAIAKGFGCDAVGNMLRRNGVRNYIVEIGGEVLTHGKGAGGRKWRVSIDRPVSDAKGYGHVSQNVMEVSEAGIATSGNYRNFQRVSGKSFGHTISPVTGRPVETDLISATIVAATAMEADAYATACMAMGGAAAKTMVRKAGVGAMLIYMDSTVWINDAMRKLIVD